MISLLEIAERTRKGGISELDIPALMKILSVKLDGQPVEPGRDIRECWDLARNRPQSWYLDLGRSVQRELAADLGLVFE